MAGGDYNQGQGNNPYPQQPNQYPAQPGYPPQGQPGQGYQPYGQAYQPYGQAYQQPWPQGFATPPALPTECFGGFWIRFVAYFIDALVLAIPSFVVGAIVLTAFGFSPAAQFEMGFQAELAAGRDPNLQLANNLSTLLQILLGWGYYGIMHSQKGATLGKMAVGLRVVEQNGLYPSFARASGRYFATILSSCLCLIGYIWAGFHPQKRALHDLIAGTWVVRKDYVNPQQIQLSQ